MLWLLSAEDQPRPLNPQHFEGIHARDPEAEARISNLDFLGRIGRHFMGDNGISSRQCMRDQEIVSDLQECVDGADLVSLTGNPPANRRQCPAHARIWLKEKLIAVSVCPVCGIIRLPALPSPFRC